MMAPNALEGLCRALVGRGWWVTAAETTHATVIIGFNFMPGGHPSWLKAFEVPHEHATVEGVEAEIEAWKAKVRHALANGGASETVRKMIAEHGPEKVGEAMDGRLKV